MMAADAISCARMQQQEGEDKETRGWGSCLNTLEVGIFTRVPPFLK